MMCSILRANLRAFLASVSHVSEPEKHPYNQAERQKSETCLYLTIKQ